MQQFGLSRLLFRFPSLPDFHQTFLDRSESANYNRYHRQPHIPQLYKFCGKFQAFVYLFHFLDFHSVVRRDGKVHYYYYLLL